MSHHHLSPMKDSIQRPRAHHFDCELVNVRAHVLLKQPQVVLHAFLLAHGLVWPPLALQEAKVVLQTFLGPGYPLEDALWQELIQPDSSSKGSERRGPVTR